MRVVRPFNELLEESVAAHGHMCAGQVIGVRMAMLGCRLVGIDEPKSPTNRKKLIVYVEIDRCATDAIQSVTGCRMGKRTLKFKDFGINAATFVNLETNSAYRIVSTEESRILADRYAPEETVASRRQLMGYKRMPDEDLFTVQPVKVLMSEWETPGPTKRKVACHLCGQVIRDGREFVSNGHPLCQPCAGMAYFVPCVHQNIDSSLIGKENF